MKKCLQVIMVLVVVLTVGVIPQAVYSADEEEGIKLTKEDIKLLTPQERAFIDELDERHKEIAQFVEGFRHNTGRPFFGGVDEITECWTWFLENTPVCNINSAPAVFEGIRKSWNNGVCAGLEDLKRKIVSQYGYLMENWYSPDTRTKWESERWKYYNEWDNDYWNVRRIAEMVVDDEVEIIRELLEERKKLREKAKPVEEEVKEVVKEAVKETDKDNQDKDSEDLFDTDCFIATAAYGNPTALEIDVLRQFRDEFLVHNYPGRLFVEVYYATSPPIAGFISEHEILRFTVREGFVSPIVTVLELTESWWAK